MILLGLSITLPMPAFQRFLSTATASTAMLMVGAVTESGVHHGIENVFPIQRGVLVCLRMHRRSEEMSIVSLG